MKKGFFFRVFFLTGLLLILVFTLSPPQSWAVSKQVFLRQLLEANRIHGQPGNVGDATADELPFSEGIPALERAALIALYNSTDGDEWNDNSGWKTQPLDEDGFAMPGTENTWFGVTCNMGNTIVLAVELSDNHLAGEIPGELGNLASLQNLNLAWNQLTGNIPEEVGNLAYLEYLALDHNLLSGTIPGELGNLGQLGFLWLHHNDLTGGIPAELGNLENLRVLSLGYNRLSGTIPPELADLITLEVFLLNSNDLAGSIPEGLANLPNLGETDIGYNSLYTENAPLLEFLSARDPDWHRTQTIAPTALATKVLSDTSVRVIWTPIDYDVDSGGYRVYYSTDQGGPYEFYGSTADKTYSSKVVHDLDPDTNYYFVVRTRTDTHEKNKNTVDSEYSQEVSALTSVEPSITVISPNGYEKLRIGTLHEITWESTGEVGDVLLEYSTNNGETWTDIDRATENDGSFVWEVPDTPSDTCRLRISEVDGQPADISQGMFSIRVAPTVALTSPNGGEQLTVGSVHQITWTSGGDVDDVKIKYSATGGETWSVISPSTPNNGGFQWSVPDTPSESCLVRLKVVDEDDGPSDMSDAVFSIVTPQPPSLTITSPNGAEIWTAGMVQEITWQSSGEVGDVKIEYSTTNGETWGYVAENTENDGSYRWTVPETPSDVCRIRISEIQGETVDISNGPFTIVLSPSLTVTSPNGGEQLVIGSNHPVTWQSSGIVGTILIEYSTDNGESWIPVTTSTPNSGGYGWNIPETPSDQCLIRIIGCDVDGSPVDISDEVFSIIFE